MNSTELIAAIRHTLMTGLAHNAAIAALNEIAASINSVVCEAGDEPPFQAFVNLAGRMGWDAEQEHAGGLFRDKALQAIWDSFARNSPPPGSARDSAEADKTKAGATVDVSTPYQFWLIERGPNQGVPQHQWWNEGPDGRVMGWKDSVHEATRYPSKEAAEKIVCANRGLSALLTAITSHSFMDAAGMSAEGGEAKSEPQAWQHEEDPDRVISAAQKTQALKDGGASASSVKPYSIALFAASPKAGESTNAG